MNAQGDMRKESSFSGDAVPLRPLVIFGAGEHAVSVANIALSAGYKIECFVDKEMQGLLLLGYKIIGDVGALENTENFSFSIAVGDNAVRESVYKN